MKKRALAVSLLLVGTAAPAAGADDADKVRDLGPAIGDRAAQNATTVVSGRWTTTIYGFIKGDVAYDTTQSFNDLAGAGSVARPGGHPLAPPSPPITFQGDHGRTQFSLRDSRFGLRVRAPETASIRPTAQLELDFFGTFPSTATEGQIFTSPIPRMRHAFVKLETPVIDFLAGQTWHLFGWQNLYHPTSVQPQGLPGQLYSRAPQFRISKVVGGSAVQVETAVAVVRPPARDSAIPELEGGVRIAFPGWTGVTTAGATGTSIQPLSIAASVDVRDISVPEFSPVPKDTIEKTMSSIALDAFIPVLPAKEEKHANALSLTGEVVFGRGSADLYTNFTGGMQMPVVANNTGLNPRPSYPQNIDNGIVVFDLDGNLHAMQWTTFMVGAQYYLPIFDGRVLVAANYSHMESSNAKLYTRPYANVNPDPLASYYTSATQVRDSIDFVDANLIVEPIDGLRFGLEGAVYLDRYADDIRAVNQRLQFATIWMF